MRAVSTVVDATLFLLVLGLAVGTLVGVPALASGPTPDDTATDRADAVAEHLATGTARVNYSLAPAARALDGDPPIPIRRAPPYNRSAHGAFASLLGDAAVATVTVDGRSLSRDGRAFEDAVVAATERRVAARNHSVRVRAAWEPYPGAPVAGRTVAGWRPPPTEDVSAASVTVDGSVPASRSAAVAAARDRGYEGVADEAAEAVVAGLFPPDRTRLALRGRYPADALAADRYARARAAFGGAMERPTADADVPAANDRLADALADRFERDLRSRYSSPVAAARNVSTGTVTVTVRTWSP